MGIFILACGVAETGIQMILFRTFQGVATLLGYRAVFWTCLGLMVAASGIGAWGLRKAGKVGLKRE